MGVWRCDMGGWVCRYDTDAKLSDEESGEEAEEEAPKAKKRKKESSKSAAPAKRQKKEVSGPVVVMVTCITWYIDMLCKSEWPSEIRI